jgi:hypothetical protein
VSRGEYRNANTDYIMRSFRFMFLTKYYDDKMKKNEKGWHVTGMGKIRKTKKFSIGK